MVVSREHVPGCGGQVKFEDNGHVPTCTAKQR